MDITLLQNSNGIKLGRSKGPWVKLCENFLKGIKL